MLEYWVVCVSLFLPPSFILFFWLSHFLGNDPDNYRPGGDVYEIVKGNNEGTETEATLFSSMQHGWLPRGDIHDEAVKEKIEEAILLSYAFLQKHF